MPSVIIDITFGAAANFFASLVAWRVGLYSKAKNWLSHFVGCLAAALVVTFIVGSYLAVITQMDFWVWWLGIGAGSLIAICGIGYSLLEILKRIELR